MTKLVYITLALIFFDCSQIEKPAERLHDKTLKEISTIIYGKSQPVDKSIIVINDKSCGTCNQEFCLKMSKFINNPNCEIILSANENALDLSVYKQPGTSNVFIDKHDNLYLKGIVSTSTVFFIKNNAIDTLIEIHPEGFEEKLNYIDNHIK